MEKSNKRIIAFIIVLFMITVLVIYRRDINSPNTFIMDQFENAMEDKGYDFEIKDAEKDFLPTTRKRMIIDEKVIDIYLFNSDKDMENEASRIDSGGCGYKNSFKAIQVSWVSFPHYYKKGSLIIQYIGEDETIMSDLTDILGEQFAGYIP
ncbi:MAG: hypothetical protein ACYDEX_09410 [Mobilitalea sp.]